MPRSTYQSSSHPSPLSGQGADASASDHEASSPPGGASASAAWNAASDSV